MQDYEIRDCRGSDEYPEILRLLDANYVHGEPTLVKFLDQNKDRITKEEKIVIMDDLMRRYETKLENLLCRVVVHRGKIVGVNLMYVEENPALVGDMKRFYDIVDEVPIKSRILAEYFECVVHQAEEEIDFFKAYPHIKRTLELVIISVDVKHRGNGLAKALIQDSIKFAKANGIDLIFGQFTSPFSKKAAEKAGFWTYVDVDATKLRDLEGNFFYDGTNSLIISEMIMFVN